MRKSEFIQSVTARLQDGRRLVSRDSTLEFVGRDTVTVSRDTDTNVLTVLTDSVSADHTFNEAVYYHHLNTRLLGNVVLYADVTTTTMTLIDWSAFNCLL